LQVLLLHLSSENMATSEATPSSASVDPHQEVASKEISLGSTSHGDTVASPNYGSKAEHVVALPGGKNGTSFPQLRWIGYQLFLRRYYYK
jgi:hypothetical protein